MSGKLGQAGGGAAAALRRQKSLINSGVSSWQHNVAFLPCLRPSLCPVYQPQHCTFPRLHAATQLICLHDAKTTRDLIRKDLSSPSCSSYSAAGRVSAATIFPALLLAPSSAAASPVFPGAPCSPGVAGCVVPPPWALLT